MLFDNPRAAAVLPISSLVCEATLTRRAAGALRRLSLLIVVTGNEPDVRTKLVTWLSQFAKRDTEIVLVADGPSPATWESITQLAAEDYRVRPVLIRQPHGFAEGLRVAIRQMQGDIAVIAPRLGAVDDSDFTGKLAPIYQGRADAVFTSDGSQSILERLRNFVWKRGFGLSPPASLDRPIVVRADVLRHLRLTSHGEEVAAEIVCRLAQWGAKLAYVSAGTMKASSPPRSAWRDAWRTLKSKFWDTQFTTHAGFYILTAVAKADQYNRWIVDQVRPYLGRRIMEAGAGIGNLSPLFDDCDRLLLADREEVYLDRLSERFERDPRVKVQSVDLTNPVDVATCAEERIDTIFCSNVLEHLEPDEQVLRSFANALQPGGHCVLVVPAGERLYTGIDAALGHYRRYEPEQLAAKLRAAGLEVAFTKRFSRLGTLGWAVSGHLLRRRTLSPRQMIWFDRLLPLAKALEYVLPVPGMSLIMVGRKPDKVAVKARRAA